MDRKSRISGAELPIAGVLSKLSAAAASPSFSSSLSSARSHEPARSLGSPSTSSSSAGISSARSPRLDITRTAPALQDDLQQAGSKIASSAGYDFSLPRTTLKKIPWISLQLLRGFPNYRAWFCKEFSYCSSGVSGRYIGHLEKLVLELLEKIVSWGTGARWMQ
jgi:hypothetical protein